MKPSEPIGNPAWGAFLVRVSVGAFFVLKGMHEMGQAPLSLVNVGFFKSVPPHIANLVSLLIPYFEVVFGSLLVVGFWTVIGAIGSSLVAFLLVYANGIFIKDNNLLNRDLIVLAGSISLAYTGAGILSIDRFRNSSSS